MNAQEAASIVATFAAAYPNSAADEATVTLWVNALASADFDIARDVALEIVRTVAWWPTIAEFNRAMTEHRRELARHGQGPDVERITRSLRCDGSGFLDRGAGLEPCPSCNPWLRSLWERGEMHTRQRPPDDYVMPAPCRRVEHGTGIGQRRGAQLALDAYRRACAEEGRDPTPAIVASLERGDIPFITTKEPAA